jgi:hypothetical protein
MKRISSILFILFSGILIFAQVTSYKEGYYQTCKEYKANDLRPSGELLSATTTDLVFKYGYNKVYYVSNKIWGFRDKEGKDYKSIDGKFYEIIEAKKLFIFRLIENNETSYRVSDGASGYPLEITPDNVMILLSDYTSLVNEYKGLSGKDKKAKALEFIARYNESQPSGDLKANK